MGRASGEQGRIHPTAIVGEGVTLGADVGIGPFSIVADGAVIGDGCEIASHVRIEGCVRLGRRNRIFQGAVLGSPPQDLKYRGEPSILDIGADKQLDGAKAAAPATLNPALGLRAIRLCLKEQNLFLPQLRAILRASARGPVRLMLPMISGVAELMQTLEMIERCRGELVARGQPFDRHAQPCSGATTRSVTSRSGASPTKST